MPERHDRLALGFDFGTRRIGIASGDTVTATASPCATVTSLAGGPDWDAIERLIRQYRPDALVVGQPLHADGTPSAHSAACDRFVAELAHRARLPVYRVDEYGSSIEAADALRRVRAAGTRRRRVQRGDLDGAAAAIILQRWLQQTRDDDDAG